MPSLNRKALFLILPLTIVVALLYGAVESDFQQWLKSLFQGTPFEKNYMAWVIGAIVLITILLFFLENKTRSKESVTQPLSLSPEENQKNYQTIRKYLIEKRYQPRLEQKLAGDQLFNLRVKQSSEGTSKEKSDTFLTLQGKKSGEEIRQIFEAASRRLLISGLPGAGKTSLLLHLALKLLQTEKETLAVLLNLATWSDKYATFDDWLREILPAELGITKRYAADILQAGKLTLLLDGLDEVAGEHRASCLKAIGEHGRQGRDYVISTRKDEYNAIEKDAPVWAQIEVLPLTETQLLAQLDMADRREFPEAPDLKAALEHDPLLLKVAETPFYLNTLQLLFRGGSTLSELKFRGETVEARQAEIIGRFTEQALAMRSPHGYSAEQVRRWLAFFSSRMTKRNEVVFGLASLQIYWKKWSIIQISIFFFVEQTSKGMMIYLFLGLITGLLFNLLAGLLVALISMLVLGASSVLLTRLLYRQKGYYKRGLTPIPIITTWDGGWSAKTMFQGIWKSIKSPFGILFLCIIYDLFSDFSSRLLRILFIVVVYILGVKFFNYLGDNTSSILQITTPYQRFTASAKALHFSILQHWLLRWQLYRAGVLPLRLVAFLNEMSARHLLETDGATWRFRHRILQEYFAGQWKENSAT